jgi:hypothetical protein
MLPVQHSKVGQQLSKLRPGCQESLGERAAQLRSYGLVWPCCWIVRSTWSSWSSWSTPSRSSAGRVRRPTLPTLSTGEARRTGGVRGSPTPAEMARDGSRWAEMAQPRRPNNQGPHRAEAAHCCLRRSARARAGHSIVSQASGRCRAWVAGPTRKVRPCPPCPTTPRRAGSRRGRCTPAMPHGLARA